MDSEILFNETKTRFITRELTPLEAAKLEFVCRKLTEDYPKKDIEKLLAIVKDHIKYITNINVR